MTLREILKIMRDKQFADTKRVTVCKDGMRWRFLFQGSLLDSALSLDSWKSLPDDVRMRLKVNQLPWVNPRVTR